MKDLHQNKDKYMKPCSYCGHENEDSATVCAGCEKELRTPPGTLATGDLNDPALDPVIVGIFENTEHAGVLKTKLEAAGIEAWIPEDFSFEFPPQSVSVQVAAKDALAARALAAEHQKAQEPGAISTEVSGRGATPDQTASVRTPAGSIPNSRACVSCGAPIAHDAVLCPKCGWTQPQLS